MEKVIKGRVFVVRDQNGEPINDIDTDMIFHNKYLAITELSQMGQYAFSNLTGWEDFPKRARPGDILIVGENFGAGSSRQQAVDCFIALGIAAIVGESFGAIYFRNAVNAGLPIFVAPGIAHSDVQTGDIISINTETGEIFDETKGIKLPSARPLTTVQRQIIEAGGLLELARKIRE